MTANDMRYEPWPGWAKALLIAQFALVLAVIIPWILMFSACGMSMGMNMGGMMPMMPMRSPIAP